MTGVDASAAAEATPPNSQTGEQRVLRPRPTADNTEATNNRKRPAAPDKDPANYKQEDTGNDDEVQAQALAPASILTSIQLLRNKRKESPPATPSLLAAAAQLPTQTAA